MEEGIERLIGAGKKQGYITFDSFNRFFPAPMRRATRSSRISSCSRSQSTTAEIQRFPSPVKAESMPATRTILRRAGDCRTRPASSFWILTASRGDTLQR